MSRAHFQFSLLRLLIAIATVGGVLACIVNFGLSLATLTIVWSALLILLMVAPLLAWYGNPDRRAFWAGVAWFGWAYVLLLWAARLPYGNHSSRSSAHVVSLPVLALDFASEKIYMAIVPRESWVLNDSVDYSELAMGYDARFYQPMTPGVAAGGPMVLPPGAGGGFPVVAALPQAPIKPRLMIPWILFRDLAHALWASVCALLGGLVAWRLSRRQIPAK